MRSASLLIGLVAVFIAILTDAPASREGDAAPTFELMHLWNTDIEAPALDYIRETVEAAGDKWYEHRVPGNFYGIRTTFANRLALQVPPDAVFWIGGTELKSMVGSTIIRPIEPGATFDKFKEILRPEILEQISHDNAYTAIPVVIHMQNIAVVNNGILGRLGIPFPKSWDEFLDVAGRIKTAGYDPLAMSDQRWQLRFVFSSILSDGLSKEAFLDLLLGRKSHAEEIAQLTRSFKILLALRKFTNADNHDLAWKRVLSKVNDGTAALTITGDFAAPALTGNSTAACGLAPGGNFVSWSFDVLAFPVLPDPGRRRGQDIGIRALSSRTFLRNFAARKGGIPVIRTDHGQPPDKCSAQSIRNWNEKPKLLLNSERWRLQLNSVSSIAQQFWRDPDPDPKRYALLMFNELKSIVVREAWIHQRAQ
ncbi:MAG: extracellular solute-binding protein [Hyphomicrobiaceae bacterium]